MDTFLMREKRMLRLKGKRELLSGLIEKRFATLPSWVTEKLESAVIEELEQWTLRILYVDNIEQVFESQLEGKLEDQKEKAKQVLFRLLEKHFGILPSWVTNKLENAEIKELEQWTLRILEVDGFCAF